MTVGPGSTGSGRVSRLLAAGLIAGGLLLLIAGLRPAPRPAAPLLGAHLLRTNAANLARVHDLGFDAVLQLINWEFTEPDPGRFDWEYADQVVAGAEAYRLQPVLRLDHPPAWATGGRGNVPPRDPADFGRFAGAVAARYRGRVPAYVIWNEPNLASEWGGRQPDPAGYLGLLRAAQAAIRRADPDALVVAAGLSPTNGDGERAIDDRAYLRALYAAGAAPDFDVLAAHPYGFGRPPDDRSPDGLNFLRLLDLRAIMVEFGDAGKPVWATEFGYTTRVDNPESAWQVVTEADQARYLVATYDLARRDLPWLTALFLWNVSADLPEHHEMQGFSVVRSNGRLKPAFSALRQMHRRPPDWAPGWPRAAAGGDRPGG